MPVEGENCWTGVGEVTKSVKVGKLPGPDGGETVCSFYMATPSRGGKRTAWVRVNVYPSQIVRYVRRHIDQGVRVRVEGELMNRKRQGRGPQLTEVRAFTVEKQED